MISLNLPKPPSVNNLHLNVRGRGRVKSPKYRAWIEEAGYAVAIARPAKLQGPVSINCEFEDKGSGDIDNFSKAVLDLLVRHQVIEDDRRSIVRRLNLSWSPEITGCQVTITPEAK
jgi:Holliday junction resolvase RusA-like endonuclease